MIQPLFIQLSRFIQPMYAYDFLSFLSPHKSQNLPEAGDTNYQPVMFDMNLYGGGSAMLLQAKPFQAHFSSISTSLPDRACVRATDPKRFPG